MVADMEIAKRPQLGQGFKAQRAGPLCTERKIPSWGPEPQPFRPQLVPEGTTSCAFALA